MNSLAFGTKPYSSVLCPARKPGCDEENKATIPDASSQLSCFFARLKSPPPPGRGWGRAGSPTVPKRQRIISSSCNTPGNHSRPFILVSGIWIKVPKITVMDRARKTKHGKHHQLQLRMCPKVETPPPFADLGSV